MLGRILFTAWEFFKPISKLNPDKQEKLTKVNIPNFPTYLAIWLTPIMFYALRLSNYLPKNEDVLPLLLLILIAYVLGSLTSGVVTVLFGRGVKNE